MRSSRGQGWRGEEGAGAGEGGGLGASRTRVRSGARSAAAQAGKGQAAEQNGRTGANQKGEGPDSRNRQGQGTRALSGADVDEGGVVRFVRLGDVVDGVDGGGEEMASSRCHPSELPGDALVGSEFARHPPFGIGDFVDAEGNGDGGKRRVAAVADLYGEGHAVALVEIHAFGRDAGQSSIGEGKGGVLERGRQGENRHRNCERAPDHDRE